MTNCPKCRSANVEAHKPHGTAHGLHTGLHLMKHLPVIGLFTMAAAGLAAVGVGTTYHCRGCGHKF